MKIGEVSKLSGLSVSRIRFYESIGLLAPAQRLSNGYRDYERETIVILDIIERAQRAGLSLEEIRCALPTHLYDWKLEDFVNVASTKVAEIGQLIEHLSATKRDLEELISFALDKPAGITPRENIARILREVQGGKLRALFAKEGLHK